MTSPRQIAQFQWPSRRLLLIHSVFHCASQVHAPHIDGTYPLSRVADAFARSRAGHVVGKLGVAVRTDEARPRAREA